jgi:hypothetical protein
MAPGTRLDGEVLIVMAKYPRPGGVKTRLAAQIGAVRACDLYRAFLQDIHRRTCRIGRTVVWAVHPPEASLASILGESVAQIPQQGTDLGERMRVCFERVFCAGGGPVVMIGADAPHLSLATVEQAFRRLQANDVVLVPARDGGYCLLGLRQLADIFSGIAMGTEHVLRCTGERISSLGLSLALLPETFDVDDMDDVRTLSSLIAEGRVELPATAAVLACWR